MKAVLTSLINTNFLPISRSRFKQRQFSMLIISLGIFEFFMISVIHFKTGKHSGSVISTKSNLDHGLENLWTSRSLC